MKTYTDFSFKNALPVWQKGRETEMNVSLCAVAQIKACKATLYASAASSYVISVNGKLIAHGPARCGHGCYRVDEIDLSKHLTSENNFIAIRTAGYAINSYAYLDVPSFICAEIVSDGKIIAFTGESGSGFSYYDVSERVQKVEKYSYQRTFSEDYKLYPGAFDYENSVSGRENAIISNCESKHFIQRNIPYGDYETLLPRIVGRGSVSYSEKDNYYHNPQLDDIGSEFQKGYTDQQLEEKVSKEFGLIDFYEIHPSSESFEFISISSDTYVDLEFERNYTGIFEFELEAGDGILYLSFDEIRNESNAIDPFRMSCVNVLKYECKKGAYKVICAEPYTLKHLKITAKGADFKIKSLSMKKIAFPASEITKKLISDDPIIKKIYDAALESFCSNTVDIYMDCPSRERAGWLCDSFFTSRVENVLTGKSRVERAYLENFLIPDKFKHLPDGAIPMCYPADHNHGSFIPNWAMWYVLELSEYLERTDDREFIDAAKERVYALLKYFKGFENEFGLLEKLEKWVFVEWSKANKLVQEVNFPTNMLYSALKRTVSKLYNDPELGIEGDALIDVIRKMSMTESGFFCDNANRIDGKLVLSGERTEACQYYAFYFDIATRDTHPDLFEMLIEDFGFERRNNNKHPEIYFANAFIGNYLRLDILERYGLYDELLKNIKSYFEYMADTTGTLWEYESTNASCNHGFASHVIYWLDKLKLCK